MRTVKQEGEGYVFYAQYITKGNKCIITEYSLEIEPKFNYWKGLQIMLHEVKKASKMKQIFVQEFANIWS